METLRRVLHRLTPRPLRRSIGMRVLTGFGLTALLAVVVASVSLAYNTDAGRGLARVTERDRGVSADFRELEAAVEQQSGAVQSFLLSAEPDDAEAALEALNAGRARFSAALLRLEASLAQSERGEALDELHRQAQAFDEVAAEEIALHRQGWGRSANFLWRTDGLQTKQRLLGAVRQQIDTHNATIDREVAESRDRLRYHYGLSLALVTVGAALAFIIGIGITRAVVRPVRDLMRVAAAVRAGDYSVRAPVTGEDELAVLSLTINTMVRSLAQSRAQLEGALAEAERSEERYRLLTDNADDLIFVLDRENRITFMNPALRRMLGYGPAELIGKPATVLYTPATAEYVDSVRDWVTREPRSITMDLELVAKDGHVVPVEVKCSVLTMGGKSVGVHGIARDMTERYRMEQDLRRLHAQDQRRVGQLMTLNEVGRKIAALQPLDTLLPTLAQTLGRTFGYHHVGILLVDDEGELSTAGSWNQPHPGKNGTGPSPFDTEVSPLALRALDGDAGFVAGSGRREDDAATRYTEVAVPVQTTAGVLGVLDIRGDADEPLDESDIFVLQTLADQIAVAIENARLYETGQRLAVSEERNRLARELHDSVTQELFSMTMIAGALPRLIERKPDTARDRAQRLYELARGALAEMRALLFALRPAALAEEGLISAVTKHAAAFENQAGVKVHLAIEGEGRLPHDCEEALYRVMQESLNNVAKHARATTVWITLKVGSDETLLTIRDDGAGFDPAAPREGPPTMGMTSMRERVEALCGAINVESAVGTGTSVHVTVPVGIAQPLSA